MPLQLPNLDDRRYADLVEEARRLIPSYDPKWTDHNPSDPGITLVELFAYLTDILIYRLNRVTEANQLKFLKLLNGPDWTPSGDLNADTRAAVLDVRAHHRAVSASDYERIALDDFNAFLAAMQRAEELGGGVPSQEWWDTTQLDKDDPENKPSAIPAVGRTACFPGRNLDRGSEAERAEPDPGHVSVIALASASADPLLPPLSLRGALWGFLDGRRILTTRHHVVGPRHAPVNVELVLARAPDAVVEDRDGRPGLKTRVMETLETFLDPLRGGPAKEGWPVGRSVYASELIEQLEAIPGVDYVTDLMLASQCEVNETFCIPAPQVFHTEGDLIGLQLADHHLPSAAIDDEKIVIAPHATFLPVRITVTVNASPGMLQVKQKVKGAVRDFLHPLLGGPGPSTTEKTKIHYDALRTAIGEALGLDDPEDIEDAVSLAVDVDPTRLFLEGQVVAGFETQAGEVINWRTAVVV